MNKRIKYVIGKASTQLPVSKVLEARPLSYGSVILNKERFIQILDEIGGRKDFVQLKIGD
jgi:hypothetical protein